MSYQNQGMDRKGLLLTGTVMGRSKRLVGEKNIEVVTYRVSDGLNTYYVDDWNPESYFEVGKEICVPVVVKPYVRNKSVFINYSIKQFNQLAEEF